MKIFHPTLLNSVEEHAAILAMERAWRCGRPYIAVQARSAVHYIEAMPLSGFDPARLPDLQILFIAWPPGWRYEKQNRKEVLPDTTAT